MHVLRDAGKPVGAVGDLPALRGAGKPAGHDGRGGHVLLDAVLPVHGLALADGRRPPQSVGPLLCWSRCIFAARRYSSSSTSGSSQGKVRLMIRVWLLEPPLKPGGQGARSSRRLLVKMIAADETCCSVRFITTSIIVIVITSHLDHLHA